MPEQKVDHAEKHSQLVTGKVTSNKMNKTIVVQVERKVKDPLYKKYVRRFSSRYVHDENNECEPGDVVQIKLVRPLSKTKRWILVKIVSHQNKQ